MRRASWRGYVTGEDGSVCVDVTGFARDRAGTITFVTDLMRATLQRPSHTGCFGLHEWAMIYRLAPQQIRHAAWPLRLAPSEVDTIVESHDAISRACRRVPVLHPPDALARNAFQPTRDTQIAMERPGCLHARGWTCTNGPTR